MIKQFEECKKCILKNSEKCKPFATPSGKCKNIKSSNVKKENKNILVEEK